MLIGDRKATAPQRLACLAECLRGLLVAHARSAELISQGLLPKQPLNTPPGQVVLSCDVKLGGSAHVPTLLRGPSGFVKVGGLAVLLCLAPLPPRPLPDLSGPDGLLGRPFKSLNADGLAPC